MMKQKRPEKKRKITWFVVLIVLLSGLLWFAYFRWSVSRRLAQQIAVLESQGYPGTLDQLNDWYQLPDGADNAADYYMEAFACRVDWNREAAISLPFVGSVSLPEPNMPLDPNVLVLMEDYLKDNAEAIQWLDKGAQCQHARYPVDYREGAVVRLPQFSEIHKCAKLYAIQMLLAIEQGEPNAFVESVSHGMKLAHSLGSMPTPMSQVVRLSCVNFLAGGLMERGLSCLVLTDEQSIRLSNSLEPHRNLTFLNRATAGDVCLMIHAMQKEDLEALQVYHSGIDRTYTRLTKPYRLLGLMNRDLSKFLELTQATLCPPVSTLEECLSAGQKREASSSSKSYLMLQFVSRGFTGRINQIYAKYLIQIESVRVALAALRYRFKYRHLPKDLTALVPEFLDEVPVDPFDGAPIRFIKQDKGFKVYSVGEDGQDNGGAERDPEDREKPYDWVFSVQSLERVSG